MYFQAETVLCSICHAVEWNLGPGLFLTRTCKHSVLTRHSTSPSVCLDCVYCPLSHSCVPLRPHLGLSRRAPVSVLCQRTVLCSPPSLKLWQWPWLGPACPQRLPTLPCATPGSPPLWCTPSDPDLDHQEGGVGLPFYCSAMKESERPKKCAYLGKEAHAPAVTAVTQCRSQERM